MSEWTGEGQERVERKKRGRGGDGREYHSRDEYGRGSVSSQLTDLAGQAGGVKTFLRTLKYPIVEQ